MSAARPGNNLSAEPVPAEQLSLEKGWQR